MKLLGINGSARSNWNTAKLIKEALRGAQSAGADIEYIDLGKLNFKGCVACMGCKRLKKAEQKCYYRDDLTEVLDKVRKSDGFLFGVPIYMGLPNAISHAFWERAIYSQFTYQNGGGSAFGRKIKTGIIFTSGAPKAEASKAYKPVMSMMESVTKMVYGHCETMHVGTTLMSKQLSQLDVPVPKQVQESVIQQYHDHFPAELACAFEFGKNLVQK